MTDGPNIKEKGSAHRVPDRLRVVRVSPPDPVSGVVTH